jgi:uncharacterized protein with HEPN domain
MKDDAVYLRHILECVQRIEEYAAAGREAFLASHLLQDATLRNLQTMSESTQRLSEAIKASQAQIPWPRVAGFRNVLVHDYMGVDIDHVWTIIESDLPALKQAVTTMLSALQ